MKKIFFADKDIEVFIGNLLRAGVIISSSVIVVGGIIYLWQHGNKLPDYHSFRGMSTSFYSLALVWKGIKNGSGAHIIQLGVLVLLATPVARVLFSVFGFIDEKDKLYIVITLIVLLIITGSIFLGIKA